MSRKSDIGARAKDRGAIVRKIERFRLIGRGYVVVEEGH